MVESTQADEPTAVGSSEPRANDSPVRAIAVAVVLGVLGPLLALVMGAGLVYTLEFVELSLFVVILLFLVTGQYVAFGGLALGYLHYRGMDWADVRAYLGVRVPTLRELGLVVGGWIAIFALLTVVGLLVQYFGAETGNNQTAELAADIPSIIPLLVVSMFLIVGPSEEILYRGVVQSRLREVLPPAPSIALASAIFAVVHVMALTGGLTARLTTVGILFVPSLVFGAVYEYTDNLVVPALLHGLHNAILLSVLYVSLTAEDGSGTAALLARLLATLPV